MYKINLGKLQSLLEQRYFNGYRIKELSVLGSPKKHNVFNCRLENEVEYVIKRAKDPWQIIKLKKIDKLLSKTECGYPPLLAADISFATWLCLGSLISIEEKISGPSFDDLITSARAISQLARNHAAFNQVTRPYWTRRDFLPHYGSYYNYCMTKGYKRLKKWLKNKPDLINKKKQHRLWFEQYKTSVDKIKLFNLLKIDAKPCHHIFPDSRLVFAIDLEEIRFGVFWEDYLRFEDEFCYNQAELMRSLQTDYFTFFKDPSIEEKLKLEDFFRALYYLQRICRCLSRLKSGDGHLPTIKRKYRQYEQRIISLLEG